MKAILSSECFSVIARGVCSSGTEFILSDIHLSSSAINICIYAIHLVLFLMEGKRTFPVSVVQNAPELYLLKFKNKIKITLQVITLNI